MAMSFQEYSRMLDIQETNCKDEILSILPNGVDIKCADLTLRWLDDDWRVQLKNNYTSREYLKFFLKLDHTVHSIRGTIWLKDGTWIKIKELNNITQIWRIKTERSCPNIPKELQG